MTARSEQAEFQRVRWRLYLDLQLARGVPSRAKLADSLDLPTSRVSQWLGGERGVEAGTAYDVGELLRTRFDVPTSGCDALFASGHFVDLFRLFRAASYDESDGALECVVARFCTLPNTFLAIEIDALDAYEGWPRYRPSEFERYEATRLRRDGEIAQALRARDPAQRSDAERTIATSAARRQFARAWELAQRPLDLPRVIMPPPSPSAVAPAGAGGNSASGRYEPVTPLPIAPPPLDAVSALADAVIALARALETRNPSLTAPRLWRMLAEWAFELDPAAFARYAPLLPQTYAHFATNR